MRPFIKIMKVELNQYESVQLFNCNTFIIFYIQVYMFNDVLNKT